MRFCFILASLTGREHLLNKFVDSVKTSKYRNADYYLYYQDVDGKKTGDVDISFFKDVYISHSRDGVCLPRMYWLHKLDGYDFYIIVDDDMEFLGGEDYEPVMAFSDKILDCGLCNTVCRRTIKDYNAYVPEMKFEPHNLQWIGGGAVIKKKIRDLLVEEIDLKPYTYDGFSLVTYLNGYSNYRYRGSVVLHKAGEKNGFAYIRKHIDENIPFFEKYITDPFKKDGKLTLPTKEGDLTEAARMLHNVNRIKILENAE